MTLRGGPFAGTVSLLLVGCLRTTVVGQIPSGSGSAGTDASSSSGTTSAGPSSASGMGSSSTGSSGALSSSNGAATGSASAAATGTGGASTGASSSSSGSSSTSSSSSGGTVGPRCTRFAPPVGCVNSCKTYVAASPPTALISLPRLGSPPLLLEAATKQISGSFYDGGSLAYFDAITGTVDSISVDQDPLTLTAGDLFGDGGTEVGILEATQVELLVGSADAGAIALPASGFGELDCNAQAQLLFEDVNGDGLPDIVAYCAPSLAAALTPARDTFTSFATNHVCNGADCLAVGAVEGEEVFVFNCATDQTGSNPTGNDTQVFAASDLSAPLASYSSGLANTYPAAQSYLQDLNGDGQPDILVLDSDVTNGGIAVLYAVSDGGFVEGQRTVEPVRVEFFGAAFGDFNGDGLRDVAILAVVDGSLFPDGGGELYPTCLEAMVGEPDGGLTAPVLVDVGADGIAFPETTPGPAIAVGDYLDLGFDQIGVLDTAGDIVVLEALCDSE